MNSNLERVSSVHLQTGRAMGGPSEPFCAGVYKAECKLQEIYDG
jgi:hypothetical protein